MRNWGTLKQDQGPKVLGGDLGCPGVGRFGASPWCGLPGVCGVLRSKFGEGGGTGCSGMEPGGQGAPEWMGHRMLVVFGVPRSSPGCSMPELAEALQSGTGVQGVVVPQSSQGW